MRGTPTWLAVKARYRVAGSLSTRSLSYGLLWTGAITAGEMLNLPLAHVSMARYLSVVAMMFASWAPTGVAIAWLAFTAERRRLPLWLTATLLLLLSVCITSLRSARWPPYNYLDLPNVMAEMLGVEFPSWTNFLYVLWVTLFHGALFNAGCLLAMRGEHTRRLLGAAQIARGRSEALLADAQLDALRARVDPAFLLRAVGEIQRRYASDSPDADPLLHQLVSFLRLAMPGMRNGSSTLAGELALAQSYTQLAVQIEAWRRWAFHLPVAMPELPFPPLLLLPLLDALTPAGDGANAGEVRLRAEPGNVDLTVQGAGTTELPDALVYRCQVALQTLFGDGCEVRVDREARAGDPTTTVRLLLPLAQARRPAPTHSSPTATKELSHG